MANEKAKPAAATSEGLAAASASRFKPEAERLQFKSLILGNPNYFGTVAGSPLPVKKPIKSNTQYEELICAGYNPYTNYLEAVVHIKQVSGYGGDICSAGTKEFVRFFLSYDNGATWFDQGMTSLTVYNVPGHKPLEYSVRVQIDPSAYWCHFENLPLVRAILSWNHPIPNNPAFPPVYGNVLQEHIQIRANPFPILKDVLNLAEAKVTPAITDLFDVNQPVTVIPPVGPGPVELAQVYLKNKVQPHRLLHNEIHAALNLPAAFEMLQQPDVQAVLSEYKVNLADLLAGFAKTDGDVSFEQLDCLGLSQGAIEWLTATFKVKRKLGYMGGLCSPGSKEYIAFWVDYGSGWNYAGTGSVSVHDLAQLPADGVEYSVSVPFSSLGHRQPCELGPKTAHVRAILSWQTLPNPSDPNFIPPWGNRLETTVLLPAGDKVVGGGDQKMYLDTVGDMAVCDINQTSGLASGLSQIAAFTAFQAPFGGSVRMTGFIIDPPNAMANPALTLKYQVSVRRLNDLGIPVTGWQPLANDFDIVITEQNGPGLPVQYHHLQQVDADGFYTYWGQIYPNQWREVAMNKIADWSTLSLAPNLWEINVQVKLPGGALLDPGTLLCGDGSTRSMVKIRLDEAAPSAHIDITGYIHNGGPVITATNCGDILKGDTIVGTYSSADAEAHYGSRSLDVQPPASVHGASLTVTPTSGPNSSGEVGTWALNTAPMDPCGFVIEIWTADRTIVNSGQIGWGNHDSKGFCLRATLD